MARKKIKAVKFGGCEVAIYRDSYAGEYVVQTKVGGKVQGGAGGGYFTDDKTDARKTAAFTIRTMTKKPACKRAGGLAGRRKRRK